MTPSHWVTIETEKVKHLLDLTNTKLLGFGSGFLDTEDVELLRVVAEIVGSNPWRFTPADHLDHFCELEGGHEWSEYETDARRQAFARRRCSRCGKVELNHEMRREQAVRAAQRQYRRRLTKEKR